MRKSSRRVRGGFMNWIRGTGAARTALLVVSLAAVCTLWGCGSARPKLRVVAEPGDSVITVRGSGAKPVAMGTGPIQEAIAFKDSRAYTVEVQPSERNASRYNPRTEELSQARFEGLPVDEKGVKVLTISLPEREFVFLPYLEVVVDPTGGLVGRVATGRAFKST